MTRIKVSIIVPAYNVGKYLAECLSGILTTDMHDKELIVVDDGSTDNTVRIAETFVQRLPGKIRVVQTPNAGMSVARNVGLAQANGEFLLFFDSDDVVDGLVIDDLVTVMEKENADIVVADFYEFNDGSTEKNVRFEKSDMRPVLTTTEEKLMPLFSINVAFGIWNKMYRKSWFLEKGLNFAPGFWFEDLDFVFRAFYLARKVAKADVLLYGYRQRPGSIMKSIKPKILDKMRIMEKLKIFLTAKGIYDRYEKQYHALYLKMALSILYVCFRVKTDRITGTLIVSDIFDAAIFRELIRKGSIDKSILTTREKIVYQALRSGLVNKTLVRTLMPFKEKNNQS